MIPSVCMTFDDKHVVFWMKARELFRNYGARVTFCVCKIHKFSDEQVRDLHVLQDDGHEISFHSRNHEHIDPYIEAHGLDQYMEQEIDRGIADHRALGFPAASFACPFHASTGASRAECAKRFNVIRAKPPFSRKSAPLHRRIYSEPQQIVHNIGSIDFQNKNHIGWDFTEVILDRIVECKGTGVFTGHSIWAEKDGHGTYSTLEEIDRFLDYVTVRGMDYVRLGDMNSPEVMTGP